MAQESQTLLEYPSNSLQQKASALWLALFAWALNVCYGYIHINFNINEFDSPYNLPNWYYLFGDK